MTGPMLTRADIEAAVGLPPRGAGSDNDLNPDLRAATMPRVKERPAAVLCGLIPREAGLQVLLTERTPHLRHHAGQIAFPGGRLEPGDSGAEAAALREAEEEVGLPAAAAEVIGAIDPYLTVTGFRVTPVVAFLDPLWTPRPDPGEVADVFEAPLDFLMTPANRQRHSYETPAGRRHYYAMPWGERYIWGATAGMLKALSDRIAIVRERA